MVQKNELFEALMMFNKEPFLNHFSEKRKNPSSIQKFTIENMIEEYIESLEEKMEM